MTLPGDLGIMFNGHVTCVQASGADATAGAVGKTEDGNAATGRLVVHSAAPPRRPTPTSPALRTR